MNQEPEYGSCAASSAMAADGGGEVASATGGSRALWLAALVGLLSLVAEPARASTPQPGGLVILRIERSPTIPWRPAPAPSAERGWPAEGAPVTWRAELWNTGRVTERRDYRWLVDGVEVLTGKVELDGGARGAVELPRRWQRRRQELAFELLATPERAARRLAVASDALAVGLYVERSVYALFETRAAMPGPNHGGFDAWAQNHIGYANRLFATAIYPETPKGVGERWRLDGVVVVEDGALPLDGSGRAFARDRPDPADRRFDIQRGLVAEDRRRYADIEARADNPAYLDSTFVHELAHARGLIDVYAFDVYHGTRSSWVAPAEAGEITGEPTIHDGQAGVLLHRTPERGLMNVEHAFLDRYSAVALERLRGARPWRGSWNGSAAMGFFLDDLPAQTVLRLEDASGEILAGARLQLFRDRGVAGELFGKHFGAEPDLELVANGRGEVSIGRNPFTGGAAMRFAKGQLRPVVLLRVERGGQVGHRFLEARELHLAFWRGEEERAVLPIAFDLQQVDEN